MSFRLRCGLLLWGLLPLLIALPPDGVRGQAGRAPTKRALLVGINHYEHPSLRQPTPLKYAVHDVIDLADVLKKAGYEVVVLSDATGESEAKLSPTKANIERELAAISKRCQSEDTFLVALAGHGLQFDKHAYFCPQDARPFVSATDSLVSVSKLYDELEQSFAGTKLVLIDACRNDPTPGRGRSGIDADAAPPPQGVGVLFSCNRGQRAYEHDDLKHGVFFHYVLQGLQGQARDDQGEVTFEGLSLFVRRNVTTKVKQLFPGVEQVPNLKADLAGIPVLIDRAAAAPSPLPRPLPETVKLPSTKPPVLNPAPKIDAPIAKAGHVITNDLGMKFAYIPPTGPEGFLMGSPESEEERGTDETQHKVILTQGFYLGVYEVTQEEYRKVMGTNPSWFTSTGSGAATVADLDTRRSPVEYVSWDEAGEFCRQLFAQDGKSYRLPTEAEWEYACRAGTTTPFHFGKSCNGTEANCWGELPYGMSVKGKLLFRTISVGKYQPNAWGLYDMHGNVWEWCSDGFGAYPEGPVTNPAGPSTGASSRVFRGGSWLYAPRDCRSANRDGGTSGFRNDYLGFRVVLVQTR